MALHNADLGDSVPKEPEDRRQQVVNLYRIGKSVSEISAILGISGSRVREILKQETAKHLKAIGTDGLRIELASELELIREHMSERMYPTDDNGTSVAPDKETAATYDRIVGRLCVLMGVSSSGVVLGPNDYRQSQWGPPDIIVTFDEANDEKNGPKKQR